jgi:RecJ-like exonuclease
MEQIKHNPKLMEIIGESVQYFVKNYIEKRKTYLNQDKNEEESREKLLGSVQIYSHHDTDGLTAGSIIAQALDREEIGFQVTILKQLEEQYFDKIRENHRDGKFLIFTDFGSGQLNLFNEYLPNGNFIILDHHEIIKTNDETINVKGFHVNPYMADINGSKEISGAGMAYLFALSLNPMNVDLSFLAIIGATGDVQNSGGFTGENKAILNDAVTNNLIELETVPIMSRSKSLSYSLAYTLPFTIEVFRNDLRNASDFIEKAGIKTTTDLGDYRTLSDLSPLEKKKLTSSLVQLSLKLGLTNPSEIEKIINENYLLRPYEDYPDLYDAKDFSKMLNACGRLNQSSVGLAVCIIKSKESITKALDLVKKYSESLKTSIEWVKSGNNIVQLDSIMYFYGNDVINENIVGVITSSLNFSQNRGNDIPIIGYANSQEGYYKVSARCRSKTVEKGVNLSEAIRSVCNDLEIKELGGGHSVAAGAKIPINKMNLFLELLNKKIKLQLGGKGKKSYGMDKFI